ncbi:hypothetical protein JTE90_019659 [Oedothorax gibbosus]|uniref:Transmembrane protein n=1 Tax=Oedothorax gibbosus TaxID=931172 RepID=A0AAV6U1C2_9ARAC|nr:hypothetical protein JTE90_019659 [Oedothorax gibbosus]
MTHNTEKPSKTPHVHFPTALHQVRKHLDEFVMPLSLNHLSLLLHLLVLCPSTLQPEHHLRHATTCATILLLVIIILVRSLGLGQRSRSSKRERRNLDVHFNWFLRPEVGER